ncbi:MAG: asparaginase [Flavobacteriaceae bacterium]|nr:asparaginase [Flavobacteriaceae bacterium]
MIQIFITGGTFDKSYDDIHGQLYFNKTHLPEMLKRSRCTLEIDIKTLMMKDSLELSVDDVATVVQACRETTANRIVITHGTDTMTHTAAALAKAGIEKTILLTGAMIPYAFGSSSDGFFNLGCALAFVQSQPNGVYVTMQGRCFPWDAVEKDKKKGVFRMI